MPEISFPYGKEFLKCDIPSERLKGVLLSDMHSYKAPASEDDLVLEAMRNPVGSPRLSELAKDKKNIVIIASDHTRPVPSKRIIPHMLDEIYEGNPGASVTILIATGCHRETTEAELLDKFGVRIKCFGHAGDGNLHIYVLRDELGDKDWSEKLNRAMDEMYKKANDLKGAVSGEHGIGYAKKPYLMRSLDAKEIELMRGIKKVFDPKNLLNPDKIRE